MIDSISEEKPNDTDKIALGVADPAFQTDPQISEALRYSIENGSTHYFAPKGFDPNILPKSISKFYSDVRGIKVNPDSEIKITHGAQEALSFSLHTSILPGDEVIVPEPTYSALIDKLSIFGAKAVFVPLIENEGWRLNIDAIKSAISSKTRMIFICNPNNPTGTCYTRREMEALASLLRENKKITILLDECYSRILYDGAKHETILADEEIRDQLFVVNSFSKTYAMTGWRLGFVISSKERVDKIKNLAFEYSGGVSYAVQYAGATALEHCSSFVDSMVLELGNRRKAMLKSLTELKNIHFDIPAGGFEVFPDFSHYGIDSMKFSEKLEVENGVSTIPGRKFGPNGEGHVRLVFCSENSERITEGVSRIGKALVTN